MSVKPSSINNNNNNNVDEDSVSTSNNKRSNLEESDEELLTVPDVEAERATTTTKKTLASNNGAPTSSDVAGSDHNQPEKRRRGRNPVDKEYRRLKRLLRNRVSAQQARERKKVYVSDLESRAQELQDFNSNLEHKISTIINENAMLRKVLMNTRPKVDESNEFKEDITVKT